MSLPFLYSAPQNQEEWRLWSFNHAANHYDWIAAANAKQVTPVILDTSEATAAGSNVLTFASTTSLQINGTIYESYIADLTDPDAIPSGTLITGSNSTQIQMSQNAQGSGVGSGDEIAFTNANPVILQQFILDPMSQANLPMWLYQHQVMHNQINAVLGTSGYNLLEYDWTDPDSFSEWLMLNGSEHVRISQALGIG